MLSLARDSIYLMGKPATTYSINSRDFVARLTQSRCMTFCDINTAVAIYVGHVRTSPLGSNF
jgi:hypothetical protein